MNDQPKLPAEVESAIREVLEFAREIMDITKPLAPLGDELVGIPWEGLRFYRRKNALIIRDRVHKVHRERGIETTFLMPPGLGIPLLDAARRKMFRRFRTCGPA